jgi:hypothetical protein
VLSSASRQAAARCQGTLNRAPYKPSHNAQAAAICGVLADVPAPFISQPSTVPRVIHGTLGVNAPTALAITVAGPQQPCIASGTVVL